MQAQSRTHLKQEERLTETPTTLLTAKLLKTVLLNPYIPHEPTTKQAEFLVLDNREAFYGGAARGGKTDALLMAALQYVDVPGYSALILRRTLTSMKLSQEGIMSRLRGWLEKTDAYWNGEDKVWYFPAGSSIKLGYCEHEEDVYQYQGAGFQFIGFDELTQFSETQYRYLISRLSGPNAEQEPDNPLLMVPQRIRAASNPGGRGHVWVKQRFISKWARLKFGRGTHVSRKRVLRLMRENNLLSPYRRPQMPENEHDGTIITDEPNVMWGTDGAKVFTRCEGWGWIFVGVEHWNAEVMGWHVCKKGDRFAALEPISMGILSEFGSVERGAARGLSLRMDHGTQYLSDHFQNQIKAWGIAKSFAFLEQPQTNGVAERFLRTLQEQAIYGRVFDTIEEVRQAVADFVDLYNNEWLIEKNGYLSPRQMRKACYKREMEAAA